MNMPKFQYPQLLTCACGGNPICIPHVMPRMVASITIQDPIEDEPQAPVHQSFRCSNCGKESAVRECPLDAIGEWNKMMDEAKRKLQ